MSNSSVSVGNAVRNLNDTASSLQTSWLENIQKIEQALVQHKEALLPEGTDELSVLAQDMLEKVARRAENCSSDVVKAHKQMHHPVSKIGKELERHMQKGTCNLIRNEKDLEANAKCQRLVEGMLSDYMMCAGFPDVAAILVKEAGLGGRLDDAVSSKEERNTVMVALENHQVRPAIDWLETYAPGELRLRFDLLKQEVVEFVREGKCSEALVATKKMSALGYDKDTAYVMGAVVRGSKDSRYESLFSQLVWQALSARLSQVMSHTESNMEDLVETGTRATCALMRLKRRMGGRKEHLFTSEELPCAVPVSRHVHNIFTCPILRQQSTESNPPMRLNCGHVISREALHKLSQSARHFRLKCPYCPDEAPCHEAKRLYF